MAKKAKSAPDKSPKSKPSKNIGQKKAFFSSVTKWGVGCFLLAAISGFLNKFHVEVLFENDKHFSHLSTMERDMAFRTEMGLYYSYYKDMVDAESWWDGFNGMINDDVSEHPKTINVLKRFNLWPELFWGTVKRIFNHVTKALDIRTQDCWQINRGEGKTPVQSCEGIGDDHYFYVFPIWWLTGFLMFAVFVYGATVSESIWGGLIAVSCYFFNHGEATRVMWTPPLRESWSFPFLIIQLFLVTKIIASNSSANSSLFIPLVIFTSLFMITWQFAQFALLTQTASVMATYLLGFIGTGKMGLIVKGQTVALAINYVLQCGNSMLLTSFFASSLLSVTILLHLDSKFEKLNTLLRIPIWLVFWVAGTICIKYAIATALQVTDDSHIFDIFRAKFSTYKNFHTQLYTCAKEFDFLEWETVEKLTKTLLIPGVLVVLLVLGSLILYREYNWWKSPESIPSDVVASGPEKTRPLAAELYTCIQGLAFTSLAIMIMRLKLFMTPQLCIVASLLASPKLFSFIPRERQISILIIFLAVGGFTGVDNVRTQWKKVGEYENPQQEDLLEFIRDSGKIAKDAAFAGSMPTMATVKLVTKRKIVNHPHYEDTELRERTYQVYTMFSRRPAKLVHKALMDLQVDYFILEEGWCARGKGTPCSLANMYDIEDVEFRGNEAVCHSIHKNPAPYFKRIFRNPTYHILELVKNPKI